MSKQKKKCWQQKLLYSLVGSTLLLSAPGLGQAGEAAREAAGEYELDEMVVTASRMPTKLNETAAHITVIGREEIEQNSYTTIAEALTRAGVKVESEGGSAVDSAKIMLNGSEQVVVLVDGRRVVWEQQVVSGRAGYSLDMLPNLSSVEKIEVVRGAASSLYGSSAVGGVVNIITRKGEERTTTAAAEFGSWDSRRYRLQTGGKEGHTGYMVTVERWTQDNYEYKDPKTGKVLTMPNSDFDRDSASVRIDRELKDGTLTFSFDHLSENGGYPVVRPDFSMYSPDASRHIVSNNVGLAYQWRQGEAVSNQLQVYRNHYSALWHRYRYNSGSSNFENQADGIEWNQQRRLSDRHTLLTGFDWRRVSVGVKQMETDGSKMRNLGLFLEDRWTLDPAWTLNAGIRRDDHSVYGNESTSHIGINRKVDDHTNMYLSWGQVYRGPDADDLFMPDMGYYKGNPDLKPEKGHTTTLGINTALKTGTAIQASLFSTYLKDAIDWDRTKTPWIPVNIGKQKKRGLELEASHPLTPAWDVTAGYSYVKIEEDKEDGAGYQNDVRNSQPNAYRLGVRYHQDAWNVSVLGRGATGRSLDGFTSKRYWVLDVAASYQMRPDVKLYAKAYNLTNRAYETNYVSGWGVGAFPMASRQIVLGVEGRL